MVSSALREPLLLSLARWLLRACALWLTREAASEVRPPTTEPEKPAIAEK
jgi:hypothetical protein